MFKLLILPFLIFFFSQSQTNHESIFPLQQDTLQYKTIPFYRDSKDCKNCKVRVHFVYPKILHARTFAVRDSLNKEIRDFMFGSVYTGKETESPEDIFQNMVQEYDTLLKKFPRYPQNIKWYLYRNVKIIHHTSDYISVVMNENVFTGGAHPLSTRFYNSYDNRTGHRLNLNEIIKPGMMDSLLSVSEKIFRSTRSISPDSTLGQAGFWFDNNRFTLNNNFALSSKGLVFYYNPYEIAPYAWGPTQFIIPRDKVKRFLKSPYQ
ncbi:MAG TPA: DUF3298 domain-containing protein [Balneolales bacterium]|nr:DUF3298 domain-containing protein [Balneolales bacterium]